MKEPPSADLMDKICGNMFSSTDAEDIFNKFQFAASFAFAPKLFTGAARSWPPPFAQGEGILQDALDFIKDLYKGKSKPTPAPAKPTEPKLTDKPLDKPTDKPTDKPSTRPTTTPHEETHKPQSSKQASDEHKQCKRADGRELIYYPAFRI